MANDYQVIIIGGGPGGMSALLWCHSLGLRAVLLEQAAELGGQLLLMFHRTLDYPGVVAENGRELRDAFESHLRQLGLEWRTACRVDEVDLQARRIVSQGETLTGGALILGLGARKRGLGVPGEAEAVGRGLSYSATRDHQFFAGRRVCVVGGGDSAFENCLILARVCPQVTLIHRGSQFRARESWRREVLAHPRITLITDTEIKAVTRRDGPAPGQHQLDLLAVDRLTGATRMISTEGLFVRIGIAPNTEFLRGQLALDSEGYIVTDRAQRTSVEAVYAVGDVCRPVCLSVAAAVGQGAIAAKDVAERLKAGSGQS